MSIVKRQHYVWQEYLRSWAHGELIYTLLSEKNEVKKISLVGVAQQRYFYKLIELTDLEIRELESFIKKSHSSLQGLQSDFLFAFTSYSKIAKQSKANSSTSQSEKLRELEINTMEKAHGMIEGFGAKLIACSSFEDINTLFSINDDKYHAIIFLCLQHFRTSKMKSAISQTFEGKEKILADNTWNIMAFLMGTNVAMNLSLDRQLVIRYFNNLTDIDFVTTDQPAINLLANNTDEEGNVKELELYYPLSPRAAITLHFKSSRTSEAQEILINVDMVNYFNNLMIDEAHKFSFSTSNTQLEDLKRT